MKPSTHSGPTPARPWTTTRVLQALVIAGLAPGLAATAPAAADDGNACPRAGVTWQDASHLRPQQSCTAHASPATPSQWYWGGPVWNPSALRVTTCPSIGVLVEPHIYTKTILDLLGDRLGTPSEPVHSAAPYHGPQNDCAEAEGASATQTSSIENLHARYYIEIRHLAGAGDYRLVKMIILG